MIGLVFEFKTNFFGCPGCLVRKAGVIHVLGFFEHQRQCALLALDLNCLVTLEVGKSRVLRTGNFKVV